MLLRNPLIRRAIEWQNDEWVVGRRYFRPESMNNKLYQPSNEDVVKALLELESA